eukprot:3593662-Pyramimonas_sp.AAC.1
MQTFHQDLEILSTSTIVLTSDVHTDEYDNHVCNCRQTAGSPATPVVGWPRIGGKLLCGCRRRWVSAMSYGRDIVNMILQRSGFYANRDPMCMVQLGALLEKKPWAG